MALYDFAVFLVQAFFVVVIALSILFGVLLPLVQNLSAQPQRRDIKSPVGIPRPVSYFPVNQEETQTPSLPENQEDQNRKALQLALENKSKTTQLIKNWIHDNPT